MKNIIQAVKIYFLFTILLGLAYPVFVTLIGQTVFPNQSNGSIIEKDGKIIGSALIAQKFENAKYFFGRPSAVDFNPLPSGGSNLGPTSGALKEAVAARQAKLASPAPQSLLYASGSGLDPELDPAGIEFQIPRIAAARGVPVDQIRSIVTANTLKRQLGFLSEERINILKLNLALDEIR